MQEAPLLVLEHSSATDPSDREEPREAEVAQHMQSSWLARARVHCGSLQQVDMRFART